MRAKKDRARERWKSRFGFIWAAVGSAIGLGSIWRFPYVVGKNGGAAFILLYLVCLLIVAFPVLISEILIGRRGQLNPSGSFRLLGKNRAWQTMGEMTILTGFVVSSFYAVVSGWTLGYFLQALLGKLTHFASPIDTERHFSALSASPIWSVGTLFAFISLAGIFLYTGVRKGIERGNEIMMPLLFFILIFLAIKGSDMPGGKEGIAFLFQPDFSEITPHAVLIALGQAFFSLSLGQGTMVTYGSYLSKKESIPGTCASITLFSVVIALLAGIATFTIVTSFGLAPSSGENLMFQVLPLIFSHIPGGYALALLFFLLLFLAALTSQISAMEPLIAYLIDRRKWRRHRAVLFTGIGVCALGTPCTLSFGPLAGWTLFGKSCFALLLTLCLNILIPLGGLSAALLVGWRWGWREAARELGSNSSSRSSTAIHYMKISIRFLAPLIIALILLDGWGAFPF